MMEGTSDTSNFVDISTDVLLNEFTEEPQTASIPDDDASKNNPYIIISKKRVKCPECPRYTTDDADKLMRHIRKMHRGENPFQCFMCDYSTYNKTLFEDHVHIHQGVKPYKCAHCPHSCVSKKNLKKHERIHRPDNPLKCPICNHIARHKKGLDFHAKKCHLIKSEKGPQCKFCNKTFDNEDALVYHTSNLKKCNLDTEDKKKCPYAICTHSLLKLHKALEHGKVEERVKKDMFKCQLCEWSSSNKKKVLLHLIHHPDQLVDENIFDISILRTHGIMS